MDKQVSSLRDIIQQMIQEIRTQQLIQSRTNYSPKAAEGGLKEIVNIRPFSAPSSLEKFEEYDEGDEADDEEGDDDDGVDGDDGDNEGEAGFIDDEVQDIQDLLSLHDEVEEVPPSEEEEASPVNLDDFDSPEEPDSPEEQDSHEEPEIKHIEITIPAEPSPPPPSETEEETPVEEETIVINKIPAAAAAAAEATQPVAEKPSFRHLNIQQLKQIVVSKGLATNTSKMKKDDLLHLLDPANTLD